MKRGEPLKRKTPLKPGKPLARSSLKPGKGLLRGKGLNPKSAKRSAGSAERKVAVQAAFERDGWRLVGGAWVGGRCIPSDWGAPGRCMGRVTPHRLKKGSAGGEYILSNVVSACSMHNDWIEDEPDLARSLGLVIR